MNDENDEQPDFDFSTDPQENNRLNGFPPFPTQKQTYSRNNLHTFVGNTNRPINHTQPAGPWPIHYNTSRPSGQLHTAQSQLRHRTQLPFYSTTKVSAFPSNLLYYPQSYQPLAAQSYLLNPIHNQQHFSTGASANTSVNPLALVNNYHSVDLTEVDPMFLTQAKTGAESDPTSASSTTGVSRSKITACVIVGILAFLIILALLLVIWNQTKSNGDAFNHVQFVTVFDGRFNSHCPPIVCNMTCADLGVSSSSSSSSTGG